MLQGKSGTSDIPGKGPAALQLPRWNPHMSHLAHWPGSLQPDSVQKGLPSLQVAAVQAGHRVVKLQALPPVLPQQHAAGSCLGRDHAVPGLPALQLSAGSSCCVAAAAAAALKLVAAAGDCGQWAGHHRCQAPLHSHQACQELQAELVCHVELAMRQMAGLQALPKMLSEEAFERLWWKFGVAAWGVSCCCAAHQLQQGAVDLQQRAVVRRAGEAPAPRR